MSDSAPLHCLVYLSQAARPMDDAALTALLTAARRHNASACLTGLLFFEHDLFLQCLEGPRAEIHALYQRIQADPRHHRVQTILDRPVAERQFSQWTMAFCRQRPRNLHEGFDDLLERYHTGELIELNSDLALDLLFLFQQNLPQPTAL